MGHLGHLQNSEMGLKLAKNFQIDTETPNFKAKTAWLEARVDLQSKARRLVDT